MPPNYITTSSGVRIGCAYQPPPAPVHTEAQRLQSALLEPRTAAPMPLWRRVLGALWSWA